MKEFLKINQVPVAGNLKNVSKLENELRASEIRYRRLFESAKDGILILDAETGKIIDVNPFLINLLGYSKKRFIEKEIWEIGLFKDIAANKEKFVELQKKEYVRYENLPIETAEGRKVNVEFVSNVYFENHQKIIQCNIRDITDRKKRENELIKSENIRHTLLQTIPDLIWMKDVEGRYVSCNKMFERFFGSNEAAIIGKTDYDFVDRKLADFFRENDRKAMYSGKFSVNEEWITFADDGHRAYLETIKAPVYAQKNLIGVLGIGRDMTKRRLAENALLESEIRYRSFFENNIDAIFLTSADGKTLSVNQAACDMFGYSSLELIELGRSGVEDKSDPRLSILMNERAINGKVKGEATFVHKEGTHFQAEISSSLFKNSEGLERASLIIHDISDRKRAEEELILAKEKAEKSDHLKSAFLANMSHEIRTPMNGILGFTELLKEPRLSGEEKMEYINVIEESGARMLNLINDIISISKVESGQMEVYNSVVNINELIENICAFFGPETQHKNLKLSFSSLLPVQEAIIKTDKEKVDAILTNLVKNAIKFTSAGSIAVGYERKGSFLEFFVKDSGIGVLPEQIEIIFERFRQGSESLVRNYEGAGLGLSISKAYTEILGGEIRVESNVDEFGEKNGSIFYFTIPYKPENTNSAESIKIIPEAVKENQVRKLKILIVEDDIISDLLISILIKRISSNIIKAGSGAEAIESCRRNPNIDLILMDIKMPEIDGYEATRQIRKFNKKVVIIAQTAYCLPGDRKKALEAGCNEYIAKPINLSVLNNLIKKLFT